MKNFIAIAKINILFFYKTLYYFTFFQKKNHASHDKKNNSKIEEKDKKKDLVREYKIATLGSRLWLTTHNLANGVVKLNSEQYIWNK